MVSSQSAVTEEDKKLFPLLQELERGKKSVDLELKGLNGSGQLAVRDGKVVQASYGELRGNGAFMSLLAQSLDIAITVSETSVSREISLTLAQASQVLSKLPGTRVQGDIEAETRLIHEARELFFQFRRKEAGSRLITLLKRNRFYYPAWLLHGRLMTRNKNIRKSMVEARVWGNADKGVQDEVRRIEGQLKSAGEAVRRCIFCWSLLQGDGVQCEHCGGLLRPAERVDAYPPGQPDLLENLKGYEKAQKRDSKNSRILYCLFLGYLSAGELDQARAMLKKALAIRPGEGLFVKGLEYLDGLVSRHEDAGPIAAMGGFPSEKTEVQEPVVAPSGRTVLLVEDSPTARKVVTMLLERKGYTIAETESGAEALAMVERIQPDLVLLDVVLPDMSGYDALKVIRENFDQKKVPVVMLTSKSHATDRMKGMAMGANEYLTKPFDPGRLSSALEKYLVPELPAGGGTISSRRGRAVQRSSTAAPAASRSVPVAKKAQSVPFKTGVQPPSVTKPESGASILVVEDSPTARKVISMVLGKNGYGVLEAGSGREAMDRLAEGAPSLILLDAMLPDTTGYDILTKIKQEDRWKDVPVVMLTARKGALDRQKGMKAGSVEYLTKPFDPQKLLGVIRNHVSV